MAKRLDVPPELMHLIEKRAQGDRRIQERRGSAAEPSPEELNSADEVESQDDRVDDERRANHDRRQRSRRAD